MKTTETYFAFPGFSLPLKTVMILFSLFRFFLTSLVGLLTVNETNFEANNFS